MCGAGVWYGIRSGYIDLTRRADRNLMWLIAAGYLGLLIVCAAFTFWLPFLPAKAAP